MKWKLTFEVVVNSADYTERVDNEEEVRKIALAILNGLADWPYTPKIHVVPAEDE